MKSLVGMGLAAALSAGIALVPAAPGWAATAGRGEQLRATHLSRVVGDVMGGEPLSISGQGLKGVTEVCFGAGCVPAIATTGTSVDVITPPHYGYQGGQAQAVVPDYQKGVVDVTVKTGIGKPVATILRYRYTALTPTGREMSYVIKHWQNYDAARYGNWNSVGGDCTNFTSAALAEWLGDRKLYAGFYNHFRKWVAQNPSKDPWADPYGKKDPADRWATPAWAYVPAFAATLSNMQSTLGITRTDVRNDPATWSDVKVGDILTVSWFGSQSSALSVPGAGLDPGTSDEMATDGGNALGRDHAMVVTRITTVDGHPDVQLAAHNTDRNYLSLTAIYSSYPGTTGSFWHLPSEPAS